MFQKKSNHLKSYSDKTILESVLWLIENYLPQKKKRSSLQKFSIDNFESNAIKNIKKLASARSKSIEADLSNTKVTFTVGNWALPYLNFLKTLRLLK